MEKIKVLVVDDSAFVRGILSKLLSGNGIEVIDTAKNGREGYEKALELKPDVITMDIEMPEMSGIEAVEKITKEYPVPVIMISSLTEEGATATLDALNAGATDFIAKSASLTDMYTLKDEITGKIKSLAGGSNLQNRIKRRTYLRKFESKGLELNEDEKKEASSYRIEKSNIPGELKDIKIIGIGISTGGPGALQQIIPLLKSDLPVSIVIAQHMPKQFTYTLAERLNLMTQLTVKEAEDNEHLKPGHVYIAPGGRQMRVTMRGKINISDINPGHELYSPSVNILMDSIYHYARKKSLQIIMTGMGNDGTKALDNHRIHGGYILAQSPDTCVVAGMPNSVIDQGLADAVLPLREIPLFVNKIFEK